MQGEPHCSSQWLQVNGPAQAGGLSCERNSAALPISIEPSIPHSARALELSGGLKHSYGGVHQCHRRSSSAYKCI